MGITRGTTLGATILLSAAIILTGGAPATAVTLDSPTEYNEECLAEITAIQRVKGGTVDRQLCASTTTVTTGPAQSVSASDAKSATGFSVQESSSLVQAAAAGAVRKKTYSQFTTGGNYTVTHNGTFYYDGSRVWVGTTYRGYKGSHRCFANYAVGVSITTNSCSESGSTTVRTMYYNWQVSVLFRGSPASYAMATSLKLYSGGGASGAGVTTR